MAERQIVAPSGSLSRDLESQRPVLIRRGTQCEVRAVEDEERVIEFVAATEGRKRDGHEVVVSGFEFENFDLNPVFLWGHDQGDGDRPPLPPIGSVIDRRIDSDAGTPRLIMRVRFATHELAETVYQLYRENHMRSVSIGWLPLETEPIMEEGRQTGVRFLRSELLELSAVPIPADPQAIMLKAQRGLISPEVLGAFASASRIRGESTSSAYVLDSRDPVVEDEARADYRGVEIDTVPTAGMAEEAERGLAWREEHGRGGTEVGVARARDLKNRRPLSLETVRRMNSYFARHAVDQEAEGWAPGEEGYPSAGRIAWALWGGDAGRDFARSRVERMDAIDAEQDEDRSLDDAATTTETEARMISLDELRPIMQAAMDVATCVEEVATAIADENEEEADAALSRLAAEHMALGELLENVLASEDVNEYTDEQPAEDAPAEAEEAAADSESETERTAAQILRDLIEVAEQKLGGEARIGTAISRERYDKLMQARLCMRDADRMLGEVLEESMYGDHDDDDKNREPESNGDDEAERDLADSLDALARSFDSADDGQ